MAGTVKIPVTDFKPLVSITAPAQLLMYLMGGDDAFEDGSLRAGLGAGLRRSKDRALWCAIPGAAMVLPKRRVVRANNFMFPGGVTENL